MGLDSGLGGNRWQGYSHEELYAMLHAGPGPAAAGVAADSWSAMSGALSDIQQDISAGITSSGATWVGDAGDAARNALNPLGEWAQQASSAADVMRASAELQGDLLSKARADMPAPVPVPQQTSRISQLITAQVDYEMAEAASQVAAQRAFQVMAQYEAGTTDNTDTLGEFDQPPTLHVDTTPITGVSLRSRTEAPARRATARPRTTERLTAPPEEPVATGQKSTTPTTDETPPGAATDPAGSAESPATDPTDPTPGTPESPAAPVTAAPEPPGKPASPTPTSPPTSPTSPATSRTSPSTSDQLGHTAPSDAGTTTPSSAEPTTPVPTQTTTSSTSRDRNDNGPAAPPTPRTPAGAMIPTTRRPDRDDDPDDEHESKYLILADDIYGDRQSYTPPVIGEQRPRR